MGCIMLLLASSSLFSQLKVVNQGQTIVKNSNEKISVISVEGKGFLVYQKQENEGKRGLTSWQFTLFNSNIEKIWDKVVELDEEMYSYLIGTYNGGVNLIAYNGFTSMEQSKADEFVMVNITFEGELTQKSFKLEDKVELFDGVFINDACYFDVFMDDNDYIMKFDFSTLSMSKNSFKTPDNTIIPERYSDGKYMYCRVRSLKKSLNYDALYTIEDGVVMDKVLMERTDDDDIEQIKVINSDSLHKFILMTKMNTRYGALIREENPERQCYIAKLDDFGKGIIHKVDKATSDILTKDRDIKIKNSLLANSFTGKYKLYRGEYQLTNCIRIKNKNILVFEKYQEIYNENSEFKTTIGYLYTNFIMWCVNDEGVLEWSKNFECENVSPFIEPKISAVPYNENSFALFGFFNSDYSYKIISEDGTMVKDTQEEKTVTNAKTIQTEAVGYNTLNLQNGKFLVWGVNANNKSGKKKDLPLELMTIEFK